MNNKPQKGWLPKELNSILNGDTMKGTTNKYSMKQPEQDSLTGI